MADACSNVEAAWVGRDDTAALLRMSYYTEPSDVDLLPLRLSVALGTDTAVREAELRDLIKRDLAFVVAHQPALKQAIVAAYEPAGSRSICSDSKSGNYINKNLIFLFT